MKLLASLAAAVSVLLLVLALLNWGAVGAPSELSVGVTSVRAPLGLVLLAGAGLVAALLVALLLTQQAVALAQARRAARELERERALARSAEESRFTELRTLLATELQKLGRGGEGAPDPRLARLERRVESKNDELSARLSETGNAILAHLGEIEDKIDRALRVDAGLAERSAGP